MNRKNLIKIVKTIVATARRDAVHTYPLRGMIVPDELSGDNDLSDIYAKAYFEMVESKSGI